MKMLSRMKFWFQVISILFVCFAFGSLGAWESGGLSFLVMVLQLVLFGAMAYISFRLSAYASHRRLILRAQRSRSASAQFVAKVAPLTQPSPSRAG